MSRLSIVVICFAVFVSGLAWAQDDPTKPPYEDLGAAGIVATPALYPFAALTAQGISTGTRHATVGALPNGNFVIISNTGAAANMAAVIIDPQGNIVAGPGPLAYDNNGAIPWDMPGVRSSTGDPFLSISRDGSEVAIGFEIEGWEALNLDHPLYPDDPGTTFVQRLSTTDLSPIGTAVSVFPGWVTAPTPDETNFGYFPTGYMPNGNMIILARSRDQWSSELRNQDLDDQGRPNQTQRVGTFTMFNLNTNEVIVPPMYAGKQYGHDLTENPNQWNAEPSRGVVQYAGGCIVNYANAHGWNTVDQDGNFGAEWGSEGWPGGDGNQGAMLTDGQNIIGKTEGGRYVLYDIQTRDLIMEVTVSNWEFTEPQRSFGGMNSGGQVFQIWQEHGLFGLKTAAGRFADADGTLYPDASFVLMDSGTDAGGAIEHERGQAAFGNAHAIYINHDGQRPDKPATPESELVARIFENPFEAPASVGTWELY